jgi:hypothetical protein
VSPTVSLKLVGVALVLAVIAIVLVSWWTNLLGFSAHIGEFYAIILAELVVATPIVIAWMFKREIRYWSWRQNAPHLVVEKVESDSEVLLQEICVLPRTGQPICREMNAVFVSVKNEKGRVAVDVEAETTKGGSNTPLVFITPNGKRTLSVPYVSFIKDKAVREDEGSFVSTVCNDREREIFVLKSIKALAPPPTGRDKKFILCFSLKDDTSLRGNGRIWFPHTTKVREWMPCNFVLGIRFYSENFEVGAANFRIVGKKDWKSLSVEPVLDSESRSFSS